MSEYSINQGHSYSSWMGYGNTTMIKIETKKYQACSSQSVHYSCMAIPDCMTAEEIRIVTVQGEHLCAMAELILCGWPSTNAKVHKELQPYWLFWYETAIIHGIIIKGRIIVPTSLQDKTLK